MLFQYLLHPQRYMWLHPLHLLTVPLCAAAPWLGITGLDAWMLLICDNEGPFLENPTDASGELPGYCSILFFRIVSPIQILCKFMIDKPIQIQPSLLIFKYQSHSFVLNFLKSHGNWNFV
jgi:hypothetical protein